MCVVIIWRCACRSSTIKAFQVRNNLTWYILPPPLPHFIEMHCVARIYRSTGRAQGPADSDRRSYWPFQPAQIARVRWSPDGSPGPSMSTDQEPTFTVKLIQLILLSTYWGMQIWVTFISSLYHMFAALNHSDLSCVALVAMRKYVLVIWWLLRFIHWYSHFCAGFVMNNHLNRHTYGFIQSRLVPFYLHLGSACAFFNLTIYAVYHPSDMLNDREAFQVCHAFAVLAKTQHGMLLLNLTSALPPPDFYFLCVGDGGGHQRPVVRPDGVRDHGGHAPHWAGVRAGPGHRPVVQPGSLCQTVRDGY